MLIATSEVVPEVFNIKSPAKAKGRCVENKLEPLSDNLEFLAAMTTTAHPLHRRAVTTVRIVVRRLLLIELSTIMTSRYVLHRFRRTKGPDQSDHAVRLKTE
jgi:hypothetical protein